MNDSNQGTQYPSQNVSPQGSQKRTASPQWIAGRALTLLSHYYQPDTPAEVTEAAIGDWVRALEGQTQDAIERACRGYLRDQPRRRPTPGDIRSRCNGVQQKTGKRAELSSDELHLLDTKILPTARRWVKEIPGLADEARKTLAYWEEQV